MRTAIGQIMGYSEMLQEEAQDSEDDGAAEREQDLARIGSAGQRLLKLVDQILSPEQLGEAPDPAESERQASGTGADAGTEDGTPPSAPRQAPQESGRILVIDDTEENRELLERRLSRRGYEVALANDGESGLERLAAESFDLVLLDVMMPGIDGFEVLRRIRIERGPSDLPVIMATALNQPEDVVRAFDAGANDFVSKPFELPVVLARLRTHLSVKRALLQVEGMAQQLQIRNAFIRRTLGRYVSDEIASDLLENPESFETSGEKRRVTILLCDLRGFSSITESLGPVQLLRLLNTYLGSMAEVIQEHGGTIDEFIGDAVLAFFGAPRQDDDDAARAIRCALAMQRAMVQVNATNVAAGLPAVELGIGVASGEVVVGTIGSERRSKYGAIGVAVNLAARIESYTLGGEVLVCPGTLGAAGDDVQVSVSRQIHPKGFEQPITIHGVVGVEGRDDLTLAPHVPEFVQLPQGVAVRMGPIDDKEVSVQTHAGQIEAVSARVIRVRSEYAPDVMSNLRLQLIAADGAPLPGAFYGKVVAAAEQQVGCFELHITARSAPLDALMRRS